MPTKKPLGPNPFRSSNMLATLLSAELYDVQKRILAELDFPELINLVSASSTIEKAINHNGNGIVMSKRLIRQCSNLGRTVEEMEEDVGGWAAATKPCSQLHAVKPCSSCKALVCGNCRHDNARNDESLERMGIRGIHKWQGLNLGQAYDNLQAALDDPTTVKPINMRLASDYITYCDECSETALANIPTDDFCICISVEKSRATNMWQCDPCAMGRPKPNSIEPANLYRFDVKPEVEVYRCGGGYSTQSTSGCLKDGKDEHRVCVWCELRLAPEK